MANRKKAETWLKYLVTELTGGNKKNAEIYSKVFKSWSDKRFKEFVDNVHSGKEKIPLYVPNGMGIKIDQLKCYKLAKELGFSFYQKLILPETEHEPSQITNVEHMVILSELRRPSQLVSKKVSVTKDSTDIDYMTMQPRGDSAAASISYAELQVLSGNNLVATSRELFKSRGGDAGAWSATQAQLEATGKTSQVTTDKFSSGVESSKTLHAWLIATHRRNNI